MERVKALRRVRPAKVARSALDLAAIRLRWALAEVEAAREGRDFSYYHPSIFKSRLVDRV